MPRQANTHNPKKSSEQAIQAYDWMNFWRRRAGESDDPLVVLDAILRQVYWQGIADTEKIYAQPGAISRGMEGGLREAYGRLVDRRIAEEYVEGFGIAYARNNPSGRSSRSNPGLLDKLGTMVRNARKDGR